LITGCNLFYANKEGEYDKLCLYNNLGITREQEFAWTEDYILEKCNLISTDTESASNLRLYMSLFEVIPTLYKSNNLYNLCNQIIDTIEFAINSLEPYKRISLADYICKKHSTNDYGLFINIAAKANKSRNYTTDPDLIEKYTERFYSLLDMQIGNIKDYYDESFKNKVLKTYELQLSDIKQNKLASEHTIK
jgi:hypothetical protein